MVASHRTYVHHCPAAVRRCVLHARDLIMFDVPTGTPTEVRGGRVVLEYRVVRRTFDVEVEPPVGVMAMVDVALEPGTVKSRCDATIGPEGPTLGQLIGANRVKSLYGDA